MVYIMRCRRIVNANGSLTHGNIKVGALKTDSFAGMALSCRS